MNGNYFTVVETLAGDRMEIRSQFQIEGEFAYMPPRLLRYPPHSHDLLAKDRDEWIPATRIRDIYKLESMPLWDGSWADLKREHCESRSLDYKQQPPAELTRHVAAFANTEGGWLVFGIYDPSRMGSHGPVRGLSLVEAAQAQEQVALEGLRAVPPILPVELFRSYPDGKLVVLCRIGRSAIAPHRADGDIYVRTGPRSQRISETQWNELVRLRKVTQA